MQIEKLGSPLIKCTSLECRMLVVGDDDPPLCVSFPHLKSLFARVWAPDPFMTHHMVAGFPATLSKLSPFYTQMISPAMGRYRVAPP